MISERAANKLNIFLQYIFIHKSERICKIVHLQTYILKDMNRRERSKQILENIRSKETKQKVPKKASKQTGNKETQVIKKCETMNFTKHFQIKSPGVKVMIT